MLSISLSLSLFFHCYMLFVCCQIYNAVTILESKSKIVIFLSKSTKIEIVIFAKSLLRFFAAINGCCSGPVFIYTGLRCSEVFKHNI